MLRCLTLMLHVPALAFALLLVQRAEAQAQEHTKIEIVPNVQHSIEIKSVAVSRDGERVVSGGQDKTVKLWDAATGRLLRTFEGHSDGVTSVAFSLDGSRLLSGSEDKTLKLWDAASGQLIRSWEAHRGVYSVALSPDGTRVVSAGSDEGGFGRGKGRDRIRLWDAASGELIRVFEGHSDAVDSVAFSPDGTRLVS